ALVVDAQIGQGLADAAAVGVGADDAGDGDAGAQGAEHGGDAAGAAELLLAAVRVQQDDGRLLADARGVAPDVAVQHQVADHQHARLAEVLDEINQVGGHPPSSMWKSEIRMSKSETNSNPQRSKSETADLGVSVISSSVSGLFRISTFGFRISRAAG